MMSDQLQPDKRKKLKPKIVCTVIFFFTKNVTLLYTYHNFKLYDYTSAFGMRYAAVVTKWSYLKTKISVTEPLPADVLGKYNPYYACNICKFRIRKIFIF